jgi:hypothetical protein
MQFATQDDDADSGDDGVQLPYVDVADLTRLNERVSARHLLRHRGAVAMTRIAQVPWVVPSKRFTVTQELVAEFATAHGLAHYTPPNLPPGVEEIERATLVVRQAVGDRDKLKHAVHRMVQAIHVMRAALIAFVQRRRRLIADACETWHVQDERRMEKLRERIHFRMRNQRPLRHLTVADSIALGRGQRCLTQEDHDILNTERVSQERRVETVRHCIRQTYATYHADMAAWRKAHGVLAAALKAKCVRFFGTVLSLAELLSRAGIPQKPVYHFEISVRQFRAILAADNAAMLLATMSTARAAALALTKARVLRLGLHRDSVVAPPPTPPEESVAAEDAPPERFRPAAGKHCPFIPDGSWMRGCAVAAQDTAADAEPEATQPELPPLPGASPRRLRDADVKTVPVGSVRKLIQMPPDRPPPPRLPSARLGAALGQWVLSRAPADVSDGQFVTPVDVPVTPLTARDRHRAGHVRTAPAMPRPSLMPSTYLVPGSPLERRTAGTSHRGNRLVEGWR